MEESLRNVQKTPKVGRHMQQCCLQQVQQQLALFREFPAFLWSVLLRGLSAYSHMDIQVWKIFPLPLFVPKSQKSAKHHLAMVQTRQMQKQVRYLPMSLLIAAPHLQYTLKHRISSSIFTIFWPEYTYKGLRYG